MGITGFGDAVGVEQQPGARLEMLVYDFDVAAGYAQRYPTAVLK